MQQEKTEELIAVWDKKNDGSCEVHFYKSAEIDSELVHILLNEVYGDEFFKKFEKSAIIKINQAILEFQKHKIDWYLVSREILSRLSEKKLTKNHILNISSSDLEHINLIRTFIKNSDTEITTSKISTKKVINSNMILSEKLVNFCKTFKQITRLVRKQRKEPSTPTTDIINHLNEIDILVDDIEKLILLLNIAESNSARGYTDLISKVRKRTDEIEKSYMEITKLKPEESTPAKDNNFEKTQLPKNVRGTEIVDGNGNQTLSEIVGDNTSTKELNNKFSGSQTKPKELINQLDEGGESSHAHKDNSSDLINSAPIGIFKIPDERLEHLWHDRIILAKIGKITRIYIKTQVKILFYRRYITNRYKILIGEKCYDNILKIKQTIGTENLSSIEIAVICRVFLLEKINLARTKLRTALTAHIQAISPTISSAE